MKINLIIAANVFRAAQICQGSDPCREYLNGVYLDPSGDIVATTGHYMYVDKNETRADETRPPLIIQLTQTIKKGAIKIELEIDTEAGSVLATTIGKRGKRDLYAGRIIDASFPNYSQVIPAHETPAEAVESIGFNPVYLGLPSKFWGEPCNYHFFGKLGCTVVTQRGKYTADCKEFLIIMPTRMD